MKIYLPLDSFAVACGADLIAEHLRSEAARRGVDLQLIRNGSRGMAWLEPLAEIEIDGVRHGFGPLEPGDVAALFDAPRTHPKAIGPVEAHPFWAGQTRLTFARVGVTDPLSLQDYEVHGGLTGLRRALGMSRDACLEEVTQSGLRGRGGAGFPTGIKWQTVAKAISDHKYIVCNADEGDSATFADRMLMEGDPFTLIEGMIIAGISTGATRGYIFTRSEYPIVIRVMDEAIRRAEAAGLLGDNILGSGHSFRLEQRVGAGAYVCGEETSLLNALEGKRGVVRAKPPLPALQGLFGRPTVINNVISLATVPVVFAKGAAHYRDFGIGRSRGTIPLQLAGNVKYGGLYEAAFGLTLEQIINGIGGGTATGRPVKAVQAGGPLGAWFPTSLFHIPFGYEEFAGAGGLIGHAGLTVVDDQTNMLKMARFAFEFCAVESCGKCTPCRIGAVRGVEVIDRIGRGDAAAVPLLQSLCATMKSGSLCALGGFTPYPVLSALTHFPQDFSVKEQVDA